MITNINVLSKFPFKLKKESSNMLFHFIKLQKNMYKKNLLNNCFSLKKATST